MAVGRLAYKETLLRSTSSILMTIELHYDSAGNAYSHDRTGMWQPHPGIAQPVAHPLHVSQPDPFVHTGLNGTVSLTPRTDGTCPQGYQYALNTPAKFSTQHQHPPSPSPVASGSQLTQHKFNHNTIDPVLRPLPNDADLDLTDPVVIAEAHGYAAASKTAGARRTTKAKGKEKWEVKCGRPSGSNNYTTADTKALLGFVEKELPLGQRGWQAIHAKFSEWATKWGRPDRKVSSLKTKFKQLIKTTKPTGDGVCPPDVTRAHQIDALINERAGTRDLNDMEFDDNCDDDNTCSVSSALDEPQHVAVTKATHTEAPALRHNAHGAAVELLTRLSGAFDPATQRARDEEQADWSLANTQLMAQA
ncbi:uncharacterized protein EDB91DRAFT_1255695 [Suillus paluster]|uniref:uncharacterized protein n=1 Tax=Suillus paluster TaxID=48578 RepID=UPI001B862719|nr:uncharacterized protein EDB91DRAFT_1255695 [Suillus paluster]KAG1723304.1 hypothetical protein EDB91DRAFT_1255695 [Suillus paluster]